ncbi:hypothetical protein [Tardiphaga sp. 367_B4_N1_1]|uniref:hypothetical protein n=1 Tax=Tardiphaga sp. 367_B4_N1_1 TaxID=3240777 RepID=UPI003F281E91
MRRQLRVVAYKSKTDFTGHQELQVRIPWGWRTIDREEIPGHVLISLACCGDAGGWRSKFADVPGVSFDVPH